jgi:hypothetical protein
LPFSFAATTSECWQTRAACSILSVWWHASAQINRSSPNSTEISTFTTSSSSIITRYDFNNINLVGPFITVAHPFSGCEGVSEIPFGQEIKE